MNSPGFTEAMAKMVIEAEVSPVRFEDFCVELFRDIDGIEYVRTSRSYDLGKDGRTASAKGATVSPLICCSLRGDHIAKAREDIERIIEFIPPESLLICCATKVSEHEINEIEKVVRKLAPSLVTVRVNGLEQISQLALRYPRSIKQHYPGELETIKHTLGYDSGKADAIKLTGMRIALTTQLHDDAVKRRKDLLQNLILTALSSKHQASLEDLAQTVSESLHLSKTISEAYFQNEITNLHNDGAIAVHNGEYYITELGQGLLRERTEVGSEKLLAGQKAVQQLIAELTGYQIDSGEYAQVWSIFLDGLTNIFLINGVHVIESISAIAEGRSSSIDHHELQEQIKRIGEKIAPKQKGGDGGIGNRIRDISQAIMDIFTERTSDAFAWIEGLCCTFIDICSLGLEPNAQQEVAVRLKEIELLLDTDVVLSLLAESEPNHGAVKTIVRGWLEFGGRVYVSESVMEEAAYHAWISTREYQEVWRTLTDLENQDIYHLLDNVFVRSFRLVSRGKFDQRYWNRYIQAFRGEKQYDYSKILNILKIDHGVQFISERDISNDFSGYITQKIISSRLNETRISGHNVPSMIDKSKRDGNLVALLRFHRETIRTADRMAVIVSSSGAIRFGCSIAVDELGVPDPVMSPSSVAWMLSLVPGANLSLTSLKGILFDSSLTQRLPRVELVAMRVLAHSEEYEMHWSRRGTLVQAVRHQVTNLAKQVGHSTDETRELMMKDDEQGKELLAHVIADSIDEFASSRSEKKIDQLNRELEKLRKENEKLRERRRQ